MGCPNDCCKLGWFKREIWFADLKRRDFVCGIGGFKWPFLVMKLVFLGEYLMNKNFILDDF